MNIHLLVPLLVPLLAGCSPLDLPAAGPEDAGDLVVEQIRAAGPAIGEAALVVGPDGTSVLLDVANDAHADAVREALRTHTGGLSVDWVVLSHLHGDHIGGFDALFDPGGDAPLTIERGVILRGGPVGSGAGNGEVEALEATLPRLDAPVFRLCDDAGCDGLWQGDLEDPDDDGPTWLSLGDGAALYVALANGVLATDAGRLDATDEGLVLDPDTHAGENARSVGGFLRYGDFAYVFAGDLDGGGKGGPNVQGFVAAHAAAPWPDGAEVLHLDHHGIKSSTNGAWIDRFLPGGTRHGLVGASSGYLDAPAEEVLDLLEPALGSGRVWAVDNGMLVGGHETLVKAERNVGVHVADGGASYRILLRDGTDWLDGGAWDSHPD